MEQFPRHRKTQFPSDVRLRVLSGRASLKIACQRVHGRVKLVFTKFSSVQRQEARDRDAGRHIGQTSACSPISNCEVCKLTKTKRTRCKNRPLKRADGISLPTTFGGLATADRKNLESRRWVKK